VNSAVDEELYRDGLRFECTGCGACCTSRGENQWVYVTLPERRRLAELLGISTALFTARFCKKTDGFVHFSNPHGDCQFLRGKQCTVYSARPDQCRSFPWWPENMKREVWERKVRPGCEGIGRGRVHTLAEIQAVLQQEQERNWKRG
jgi:Fe-S-cluster containining protein